MTNRRKFITTIGTVGTVAIVGCLSDPVPANFEIMNMEPTGYVNYHPDNQINFSLEIINTGEIEDTRTVGFEIEEITEEEETITLDGDSSTQVNFDGDYAEGEDTTYQYNYYIEDEQIGGGEVFIFECPPESELPDNRPLDAEDLGYYNIERANIDVRLLNDGNEYSDSDLILIAKHVVCEFSIEYDWHAISTTFWERGDTPGFTQAYAECNWVPNGIWSNAGETELGNYSEFEYSVRRF